MLIDFSIENFRSIRNLQTISFVAANLKSKHKEIDEKNVISVREDFSLLKSIAIYGANSSGKSNVIKGIFAMLGIMDRIMANGKILNVIEPFYFDETGEENPTYFQLQFLLDGKQYRYGFEATDKEIISEWLYGPAEKTETYYFERTGAEKVRVNSKYFAEGKGLDKNLKTNNLFLNVVDALNGELAERIKQFFEDAISISMGVSDQGLRNSSLFMLHDRIKSKKMMEFMHLADFNIENIREEEDRKSTNENDKDKLVKDLVGVRANYNSDGEVIGKTRYLFDQHESQGTIKLFNYAGAMLRAFDEGNLLVIDEFDARLHPSLTKKIVEMFNSTDINKHGAQLLFVTHDSNLLDNKLLRRDQIYFAEKDTKGRTELYSLYDIKGVRSDASYEKDYISGKYGAIPYLGDFKTLFDE